MFNQKGFVPIVLLLPLLILVSFAGGYYFSKFNISIPVLQDSRITPPPKMVVTPQPSPVLTPSEEDNSISARETITLITDKILTKEEIDNWKTYTKTQNTYTIKYPPEYQVKEPIGYDIYHPISINIAKGSKMPILSLDVMENNNNLEEKGILSYMGSDYLSRYEISSLKLDTYKGLKLNNTDPSNGYKNYRVILLANKKIYTFNFNYQEEEYNLTEKILATFKIIDLKQAYERGNWMSYTSPDGKFSFRYPGSSSWIPNGILNTVNVGCQTGIRSDQCLGNVNLFQVSKLQYTSLEEFEEKADYVVDKTRTTVDNFSVVEGVVTNEPANFGSFLGIFLIHNNQGYLIEYGYPTLKGVTLVNQFPPADPDIFSTFKFTN